MDLGISSYTYNWWAGVPGFAQPASPLTPEALLDRAKALGLSLIQIADNMVLDPTIAGHLARLARDSGIQVEVGTRGILAEPLFQYLEIARVLDCSLVRTLIDSPDDKPDESEAVSRLHEIAPVFESAGVTLAIENHDRFPAAALRRIIDSVASRAVGVCLDTANSIGCGEGLETVLDRLADVVVNLHIKDFRIERLPHGKGFLVTGAPAGQGMLDIPALLGKLRSTGNHCNAILELWSLPEPTLEESIRREDLWAEQSIRYLRTLIP